MATKLLLRLNVGVQVSPQSVVDRLACLIGRALLPEEHRVACEMIKDATEERRATVELWDSPHEWLAFVHADLRSVALGLGEMARVHSLPEVNEFVRWPKRLNP